jgi:hypothetical protein
MVTASTLQTSFLEIIRGGYTAGVLRATSCWSALYSEWRRNIINQTIVLDQAWPKTGRTEFQLVSARSLMRLSLVFLTSVLEVLNNMHFLDKRIRCSTASPWQGWEAPPLTLLLIDTDDGNQGWLPSKPLTFRKA